MSLGIIGDIHGNMLTLHAIVNQTANINDIKACIQVGDFGIPPSEIKYWIHRLYSFDKPTYFIDGNHEDFDHLMSFTEVTEIMPNLFYVPRGSVLKLDNRVIAFLGGGASIDKKFRLESGMSWDDRENIREEEVARLFDNLTKLDNPKVDLFVTHVPPLSVADSYFDAKTKLYFNQPITWVDPNMIIVEDVWNKLGKCDMVCGHMHKKVQFESNSFIVDINEFRCM